MLELRKPIYLQLTGFGWLLRVAGRVLVRIIQWASLDACIMLLTRMKSLQPNGVVVLVYPKNQRHPNPRRAYRPFVVTFITAGSPGNYHVVCSFTLHDGSGHVYTYGKYDTFDAMVQDWLILNNAQAQEGSGYRRGLFFNYVVRCTCIHKS
jgi:hypothetical protein